MFDSIISLENLFASWKEFCIGKKDKEDVLFFEHKLENPAVYDKGKEKTNPLDRLKMPNFKLTKDEIAAVTTFLLGSVYSPMPARYQYNPPGQKQDIIE